MSVLLYLLIQYSLYFCSSLLFIIPLYEDNISCNSYYISITMQPTKSYLFFDHKNKKTKKQPTQPTSHHSRSLSAKSELTKNSARNKITIQAHPSQHNNKQAGLPLTKKEKQIREAIQYRFKKSKMREFQLQYRKNREQSVSSSDMQQFKDMALLKVISLKEYHQNLQKRELDEKSKNSVKNKLRIRTDSSLIIKTETNQKSVSIEKLRFLKSYLQPQLTPSKLNSKTKSGFGIKPASQRDDWRFISIQSKQKQKGMCKDKEKDSRSKNKEVKINSHRTLTVENDRTRIKTMESQSQWDFVPKLKDMQKLGKKYKL